MKPLLIVKNFDFLFQFYWRTIFVQCEETKIFENFDTIVLYSRYRSINIRHNI